MRVAAFSVCVLLLAGAGCVRRDGRNDGCQWPPESVRRSPDARHLSADAEFAEDLAIRYADAHHGLRSPGFVSGEAYVAARERCMTSLFEQIAREHGVTVAQVSYALGRNRAGVDLAVNLPFALLYCFAALQLARYVCRKYSFAEYGWIPGAAMAAFLAVVLGVAGLILGELWSWLIESYRIGNGHMSYRVGRLWWFRHRPELFGVAFAVFCLAYAASIHRICILERSRHPGVSDTA